MRRLPVWTMLPLILLAACESTGQSGTPQQQGRPCTTRVQDAGQCGAGSIYVSPDLTNVR
jgi:hypothetical protein